MATYHFQELVGFLEQKTQGYSKPATEPMVVCFGLSDEDLAVNTIPQHVAREYFAVCDWLEKDLISKLRQEIPCLSVITESFRNGETLSIRIAFWNLDVQHLERNDFLPWQVVEVAYYSEVYSDGWKDLFPKAVVSTYHDVVRDDGDEFGIKRCPGCGDQNFDYSTATDYNEDEDYHFMKCKSCGWSTGT